MKLRRVLTVAGGATAIFGMVVLGGPAAWAQEGTPSATEGLAPRPAHIHSGDCQNLGPVVQPLTDLTAGQGERVGQARRAAAAESSYTEVPMSLNDILNGDHAINVHLSAEQIDTYIACGEIGGTLEADGSLVIGLRELNNSGFTGIAFLSPMANGAGTGVSVFIAQTQGGRNRGANAIASPTMEAAGGMEMATATSEAGMGGMETPTSEAGMIGMASPTAEEGMTGGMASSPTP
ncbi:MAG: hypothetical protein IT338_09280 [Thermomicrobiales bacterium]|nr:hypothetical protein [Thermomicrobiales bacterium]